MSLPRSCGGSAHASAQTLLLLTPAVVNCPCLEDFLASLVDPVKDGRKESEQERKRERERGDLSSLGLAAGIFGCPLGSGTFATAACKEKDVEFGFSQCVDCACALAAGIFGLPIGTACQSREDTQECRCRLVLIAHLRLGDLCHRRSGSLSTEDADENAFVLLVVHLRIGDFRCRRTRRLSREDAA